MTEDKPLKSAIELAMERMAKKDLEAGITSKPLTADFNLCGARMPR